MQRRSLFRISASLALLGSGFGLAACGGGGGDPVTEPAPPAPPAPPPDPVVRTFAYVANYEPGGVSAYRVGADGALRLAGVVPTDEETVAVRVHPSGRFAYAIGEGGVFAYAIDAASGMLASAGAFARDDPPFDLCSTRAAGSLTAIPRAGSLRSTAWTWTPARWGNRTSRRTAPMFVALPSLLPGKSCS